MAIMKSNMKEMWQLKEINESEIINENNENIKYGEK